MLLLLLPMPIHFPPDVPYEVTVYTSDVNGAGTDADVFIVLYGREVVTAQKSLCDNKKKRKECFERSAVDKFIVEVSWNRLKSHNT